MFKTQDWIQFQLVLGTIWLAYYMLGAAKKRRAFARLKDRAGCVVWLDEQDKLNER